MIVLMHFKTNKFVNITGKKTQKFMGFTVYNQGFNATQ